MAGRILRAVLSIMLSHWVHCTFTARCPFVLRHDADRRCGDGAKRGDEAEECEKKAHGTKVLRLTAAAQGSPRRPFLSPVGWGVETRSLAQL